MMEWMEKYREAPREATSLTIDKPMLLFFGLTIVEFAAAPIVFFAVMILWNSNLAMAFGLVGGVLISWATRECRRRLPPRFLQHWTWSVGLQSIDGVPKLFRQRRHKLFGP